MGSVVKCDEDGAIALPVGALGDYGDSCVTLAVGGVALFLEYVKEIVACVFPSAVYIDGVLGRWEVVGSVPLVLSLWAVVWLGNLWSSGEDPCWWWRGYGVGVVRIGPCGWWAGIVVFSMWW